MLQFIPTVRNRLYPHQNTLTPSLAPPAQDEYSHPQSSPLSLVGSSVLPSSRVSRCRVSILWNASFRPRRRSCRPHRQTCRIGIRRSSNQYLHSVRQPRPPISSPASTRTHGHVEAGPILRKVVKETAMGDDHNLVFRSGLQPLSRLPRSLLNRVRGRCPFPGLDIPPFLHPTQIHRLPSHLLFQHSGITACIARYVGRLADFRESDDGHALFYQGFETI